MSERFVLHLVALILFMLPGFWFVYRSVYGHSLTGLITVMYWFGYLVYVFIVSSLYLLIRRRSGRTLIMAHIFSALLGAIATGLVMQMGEQYEVQKQVLANPVQSTPELKSSPNQP